MHHHSKEIHAETYNIIEGRSCRCLHNSDVIPNLRARLSPMAFFDSSYKEIYKKALEMNDEGAVVSPYTVQLELASNGSDVSDSLTQFSTTNKIQKYSRTTSKTERQIPESICQQGVGKRI